MKIRVDTIPQEGLMLDEKISPEKISLELNEQGIVFRDAVSVSLRAVKLKNEIFVNVKVAAPCEFTCARCLAKIQDILKKDFDLSYEAKPGDVIDIDEDVRQEIILDCPLKTLCKDSCKGLCPNCGQNLNIDKCECNLQ